MTAEKMFKEIGYSKQYNNNGFIYYSSEDFFINNKFKVDLYPTTIIFNSEKKEIELINHTTIFNMSLEKLAAINKQVEELKESGEWL